MSRISRAAFIGVFVLVMVGLAKYAYANPGVVACALIDAIPVGAEDREQASLVSEARVRIAHLFGEPQSRPIIVFWDKAGFFAKLRLNDYASTHLLGARACVFVGPKGRSLDVVGHELVHAEVFDRVGPWFRMTQVPVWFDEGLAMQVDYREKYVLPKGVDTRYIRNASTPASFFVADDQELTRNYGAAKSEVARWVAEVGSTFVYAQLARIRSGEKFTNVVPRGEG